MVREMWRILFYDSLANSVIIGYNKISFEGKGDFGMWSIIWLAVFVVLVVFEAATMGLFTIWFAGGALVAFLVSLFVDMWVVQMIVFLIVSFLLLYFTRPVAMRKFNSKRLKTNVEDISGREAKVTEVVDNFNGTGAAVLNGLEWSARSAEDSVVIPVGERVTVQEVRGVKLIVAPIGREKETVGTGQAAEPEREPEIVAAAGNAGDA